jgi:hypothetical protein
MSIDPALAKALGDIGTLSGLLKAHVEEVKRDRLQAQNERAEDRLDRQAMRADIRTLAAATDKIPAMETRLTKAEKTLGEFESIRLKVTIAAAVLSGGLYLAWQAASTTWPMIKGVLFK